MFIVNPIVCHNCRKVVEKLPLEVTWLVKEKGCNECGDIKKTHRHFEFCSPRCLSLWAQKFNGHKHQWDITLLGSGATLKKNGEVENVMAFCKICKETNYHCTDEKVINKWKNQHKDYAGRKLMANIRRKK